MTIRLKDLKERTKTILSEFRRQRIGLVGVGIIIFMLILGVFAPLLAPGTIGQWESVNRWRDNPTRAVPSWVNYISPKDYAPNQVKYEPDDEDASGRFTEITYTFDNTYDVTPRDIIVYLKGSYTGSIPQLFIEVERPDGEVVILRDEALAVREEEQTFANRYSFFKSSDSKDRIFEHFAQIAIEEGLPEEDIPDRVNVEEGRILFAEKAEDMLTNPESLQGEYNVQVRLYQISGSIETDYGETDTRAIFAGAAYGLMGTDILGRDIALGWIWGARYALLLGIIVAGATVSIGTLFGMTSAYFGGWTDEIMQRINEIVIGIPTLPIMIIIMFLLEQSIWIMIFLMSILYWRGIAKTIRARGLQIRQETYVEAAESLGSGGGRIILNHMIPQILPYSVAEAALLVPIVIITEASLSLLGLGDPSIVTWGQMLSQAQEADATIQGLWWWVLLPGIGITLFGFAFISSGMAIERVVNPKMQQR